MAGFFSLTEVMRVGLQGAPLPEGLQSWGNYDAALTGRMMAGSLPVLPWERYAGRSGRLLAAAVPDLQLALAVGLAEMRLPAVLVPDLMTSATAEVINTALTRHPDDWRAIMARAQAIDGDAIERYLGLLTVNGPLRVEPVQRTQ